MTELEFILACGEATSHSGSRRFSPKHTIDALIIHFRDVGWHDAVRAIEALDRECENG